LDTDWSGWGGGLQDGHGADEADVARIVNPCGDGLLWARFGFVRQPPRGCRINPTWGPESSCQASLEMGDRRVIRRSQLALVDAAPTAEGASASVGVPLAGGLCATASYERGSAVSYRLAPTGIAPNK